MQFTDEEMSILNRACEILSKHVACGDLPREQLDMFNRMMVSAIDGAKDEELSIEELERRYFAEDSHIYTVKNAIVYGAEGEVFDFSINSKYLILEYRDNAGMRTNCYLGYLYYTIDFQADGNKVDLWAIDKTNGKSDSDNQYSFLFDTEADKIIFIAFLGLVKEGFKYYEYAFDEAIAPENNIENAEKTWFEFFSYGSVKPCLFSAECICHNEIGTEGIEHDEMGRCTVQIAIDSDLNYSEAIGPKWDSIWLKMKVAKQDDSRGFSTSSCLSRIRWNVYLNRTTNSIFVGDIYNYTQFKITDKQELQNVYNYLAALCSRYEFDK